MVGERSVRLLGGQRQHIGLARAMYHDPEVLVHDEASNPLDNLTEKAIMEAVHNPGHRKAITFTAHRLTTVQSRITIFLLEHWQCLESGSNNELRSAANAFGLLTLQAPGRQGGWPVG